jgi:hypothetical protein
MAEHMWLDYFAGGVPTLGFFEMTLNDLEEISRLKDESSGIDRLQEICFIGLASYFEAFCKDHFASIINIIPNVLDNLKKNNIDTNIDANDVSIYKEDTYYKIGFLVVERMDFGSANKINSMYKALLGITPFSKNEIDYYNKMLRDRNLIVHHGGVYTLSYSRQSKLQSNQDDPFYNSLIITKNDVLSYIYFIRNIAEKIAESSSIALNNYITLNNLLIGTEKQKAIKSFVKKI